MARAKKKRTKNKAVHGSGPDRRVGSGDLPKTQGSGRVESGQEVLEIAWVGASRVGSG